MKGNMLFYYSTYIFTAVQIDNADILEKLYLNHFFNSLFYTELIFSFNNFQHLFCLGNLKAKSLP